MNPEFWSHFLLTGQTFFHQKIEVFQYTFLSLKSKLAFVLKYTLNGSNNKFCKKMKFKIRDFTFGEQGQIFR